MGETQGINTLEIVLVGMLGMFVLAIGVVLFFLAYQKRLLKQQKEHQQKEADYQQQLLRANLLSQEKERNRIGKDLHDEVGAMLTTSKLYFRHLDQETPTEQFDALKQKTFDLLEGTIATVRRVSHDLRPVVLETLGLEEAVANVRDQLNASGDINVEFTCDLIGDMDKEYQLNWYRIVQELINNTLKHAEADNIWIYMKGMSNDLKMIYKDNGKGLSKGVSSKTGLGLSNIESRLSLMNGGLNFKESVNGASFELTSNDKKQIQNNE